MTPCICSVVTVLGGVAGSGRTHHLEKTKMKSGLARQDSSYRWVSPRWTKRVGTHEIIVVVVVVVVEYYIYLYILLLVRLAGPPLYFPRNNTCCTNYAYKRLGIRVPRKRCLCNSHALGGSLVLAKRYVFHYFSAGLPEMKHFSNGF